jgi:hypothetical protein
MPSIRTLNERLPLVKVRLLLGHQNRKHWEWYGAGAATTATRRGCVLALRTRLLTGALARAVASVDAAAGAVAGSAFFATAAAGSVHAAIAQTEAATTAVAKALSMSVSPLTRVCNQPAPGESAEFAFTPD